MDDEEKLEGRSHKVWVCILPPCSLPALLWVPVLIHISDKLSPFLTLSDVLGFLLLVDLALAFCHYLLVQKKKGFCSFNFCVQFGGGDITDEGQ